MNKWLGQDAFEFLNLGVSGWQSEDILRAIKKWLPELRPDLVLYAVCLNDFLPSGRNQGRTGSYDFPLPEPLKTWLIKNTKVAALANDAYDKTLRGLGYRTNFFDDVLQDFEGYQTRFRRDVSGMNEYVTSAGLPPLLAIVLDQFPSYGERRQRITQAVERHLRETGAEVIDTETFYRRYSELPMGVSQWERHPNEVAHYIFARMIERHLLTRELRLGVQ